MSPSMSSLAAATEPERSQSATRSGRAGRRGRGARAGGRRGGRPAPRGLRWLSTGPPAPPRRPPPAGRREPATPAAGDAALPLPRLAPGTDERERGVEQAVEGGTIFLVL